MIKKHLNAPLIMLPKILRMEPEIKEITTSSTRRGIIRAPANGQPTIAPRPNHIIPWGIFWPPLQSRKALSPSIEVYIVKLDGRNEVEAWNMPGLNATTIRNKRPILGLSVRQTAEYSLVSQAAQNAAKANRIA